MGLVWTRRRTRRSLLILSRKYVDTGQHRPWQRSSRDRVLQHILERTHPDNVILQKTRTGTTGTIGSDPVTPEDGAISGSTRTFADPTIARTDTASSLTKDKKWVDSQDLIVSYPPNPIFETNYPCVDRV